MIFHIFELKSLIRVILVEPNNKQYIWLSFYLDLEFRNGRLSKEITKFILYNLNGVHHIHWPPDLRTFRELEHELNWEISITSMLFEGCRASVTKHISKSPCCYPLLNTIIKHRIQKKPPNLDNYESTEEQKKILKRIVELFKL